MNAKITLRCSLNALLFLSACVTSKVERLANYQPNPERPPFLDQRAVEEYYLQGWEPMFFIISLGIIPQYKYAVYEEPNGVYRKESEMIGWLALPLIFAPSWKIGKAKHPVTAEPAATTP